MKKFILSFFIGFMVILQANAQKQEWGVGLRIGEPTGITAKKYIKGGANAIEFVLGANGWGYYKGRPYWRRDYEYRRSATLMVNYLWHKGIKSAKGLDVYYGIGGQLSSRRYYDSDIDDERGTFGLGLTGALGLEWYIPETPISLSVDIGPYIELIPATAWIWFNSSLGIKVNF